jgi:Holliday junction resolvase-like predicted endonuclease
MNEFNSNIISSLKILQIAGNTKDFDNWLTQYHNLKLEKDILDGYKFLLECAFSEFFSGISAEDSFDIKADFLLKCAIGNGIYPVENLPNTCERTIFLKNIYFQFKPVLRTKSFDGLQSSIENFHRNVGQYFEKFFECSFIFPKKGMSFDKALRLQLIENLYLYFTQLKRNGPVAYNGCLLKNFWISGKKLNRCFRGYKYCLQYLWCKAVGADVYNNTILKELHLADSWNNYVYLKSDSNGCEIDQIFGPSQEFVLEEQTSLDSFFYRIKKEIIKPIEKEEKIDITSLDDLFKLNKSKHSREVFQNLLSNNALEDPYSSLSNDDKIGITLYWYPLEVFEPGQMHNGIPAFITALAGTVALADIYNEREFEKVFVSKFIHPYDTGKNNYSYGILIDSKAAAGHYSSGWLLYYDCCGDYSGFSGSEYRKAEELIQKYIDSGQVELRELKIDKSIFRRYVASHISTNEQLTKEKIREIEEQMENQSKLQKSKIDDVLGKAKAIILEQLTYYAFSRNLKSESIEWSTNKDEGEIDIVVKSSNKVMIIECKVNPNNCDLSKEHQKLLKKLRKYSESDKAYEFWFWEEPSHQNEKWLNENNIPFIPISSKLPKMLQGIDLSNIKIIMDYKF